MRTQIRLLLEDQSDLGAYCLQILTFNKQATKQTTVVVIGSLRVKILP